MSRVGLQAATCMCLGSGSTSQTINLCSIMSLVLHSVEGLRGAGLVTDGDSGGGGCSLHAPPCFPALKWAFSGLVIPRVNFSFSKRPGLFPRGTVLLYILGCSKPDRKHRDNKYNNILRLFICSIIRGNSLLRRIEKKTMDLGLNIPKSVPFGKVV